MVGDARAADAAADDDDPARTALRVSVGHRRAPEPSAGSRAYGGPSSSARAESYFSMPQAQKSKSIVETPSWIEAHSVQP